MKHLKMLPILCTAWVCFGNLANAQTLTTLHSFCKNSHCEDSQGAVGFVQAANADLYTTSEYGGDDESGGIFKLSLGGALTRVYSFCRGICPDGAQPNGPLLLATNGELYGTTSYGGAYGINGTLFKISDNGALTTLYSFCAQSGCPDGRTPFTPLIQASDGFLYGTTEDGGANGHGTIFKMSLQGQLTTIHAFCGAKRCHDGLFATGALVQGSDGDLYGVTLDGGTSLDGMIFKITPGGKFTRVYSFCALAACADGATPAGLARGSDGELYGVTSAGGSYGGGSVFKITSGGTLTTLYSFCAQSGCPDGDNPQGLVLATDGNLYGTAHGRGAHGDYGTVFSVAPGGTVTTVYSFCADSPNACVDGEGPVGTLTQGTDGKLYGTTQSGGAHDHGTAFGLSVGLAPFVQTLPSSGKIGRTVKILGTNLSGATSVTFNGVAATSFTMNSTTEIATKVPTGATTGTVQVITPGGTLSSNVVFTVVE